MTRGIAARALAIPLLVIALAAFHAYRALAHDQSSWGAGQPLGMFGRLDSHGSRSIVVRAGGHEAAVPASLSALEERALVMPEEADALARALAAEADGAIEVEVVDHAGRVIRRASTP